MVALAVWKVKVLKYAAESQGPCDFERLRINFLLNTVRLEKKKKS